MTKRGMPKPFAILIAVLMALYFVPLGALPANATVPSFEIDGNQVHNSAEDWADLTPTASGDLADSGGKTNRHLVTFVDNTTATGQDDTLFGSNNKEEGTGGLQWPHWSPTDNGNATGKSDYGRLAFYSYVENGHVFFALGFDRGSNVGGTATDDYYFELNQVAQDLDTNPNPVRTVGDVRIKLDDQGSGNITASLQTWTGSAWSSAPNSGDYKTASNSGGALGSLAPWWTGLNVNANGTIDKEGFVEASFDLTSFGVVLGCPSTGFSTVNGRSTTGNSDKNLVDYFRATPLDIPSNCAKLVINKVDGNGDPLGGATFKISPNPLPDGTAGKPADNFLTIFDDSSANTTKEGTTNYDDPDATAGTITLPAVIPGVEYTITEIIPPAGYVGETGDKKVTPVAFGGGTVSFTNTLGSVKFFKSYEGGLDAQTGATFTVTRDANKNGDFTDEPAGETTTVVDNGTNDANNTMGTIKVNNLKTGDYQIVETAAPVGYQLDTDKVLFSVPGANNNADVELAANTFQDPRKTYSLTVQKVAKADNSVHIAGAVFDLYQESNNSAGLQMAAGGDTKVGTCTTAGNGGDCTVSGLAWGHDYYWFEVSVPAPYNLPSNRVAGPIHIDADGTTTPSGTTVFEDPKSKIVTQATDGTLPGATIADTATLSGLNDSATGTVSFDLYYTGNTQPTANSCVAGNVVLLGIPATAAVTHNVSSYTTGPIGVTKAGYYAWVAHYSGDNNGNRAVDGACDDANETSHVSPVTPGITTIAQAPDDQLPDAELYDTAKVLPVTGNLDKAVANVDFFLYGPDDANCTGTPVFQSLNQPVTVVDDGANGFYATAESGHFNPTLAGTYRWVAQFDGDNNNQDINGTCNADNENSTVKKAIPAVTTDAGADKQLGPNGVALQDKATLSGGTVTPPITGTITFKLYYSTTALGSNDCTDANLVSGSQSSVTVSGNGDYLSTPVTVTKAGFYNWTANYEPGADANNADIPVHGCGLASENVTVDKAQPAISTVATDAQLPDGTVSDTATVTGLVGGDPAGKVTFTLYGPSDTKNCTDNQVFTDTVDLGSIGNHSASATSGTFKPTQAGTYWWIASYAGNDNNKSVSGLCDDPNETSTVTPANPAISTTATDAQLPSGTIHDVAHLTDLTPNATGTVTFKLWGPSDTKSCVGGAIFTDTQPLGTVTAGGAATVTSASFPPVTAGNYWWIASYHSGDANNTDVAGTCGDTGEKSVVSPASPLISTSATVSATLPAGTLTDTATLTGLSDNPTGKVSFTLYGPDTTPGDPTCSAGTLVFTSPDVDITPSGGGTATASSPAFTPSVTGTYFWIASYLGDANNDPVAGNCGDDNETSTVEKAGPSITTQVPHTTEQLSPNATLTDTATLTGGTTQPSATGTITFTLYGPFGSAPGANSCTAGNVVGTRTATVNGNGSYSPATGITVNVVGFYTWVADYSGDANNESAIHACGQANETVHVLPTQGTITTDAVDHVKLSDGPTTISDQATLSGVTTNPAAGGTIEFKVYGPFPTQPGANSCTEANLVGGGPYTVTVNGPDTYTSPDVQVKKAGFYVWMASYSGDDNNSPAAHACGQTVETTTVQPASPTITTQVAAASVALPNASLMDTATLAGGTSDPKATGTITFRLYGPFAEAPNSDSCTDGEGGNLVDTEVVTVTNGNGSYPSPAVIVQTAGYYTWVATYSGDDNNESATHACAQESETVQVTKAAPSVATVATESTIIQLGGTISDAATVSGLAAAGTYGTVTFALYGPNDDACDSTAVFTSTVDLTATDNGDGTASGTAASGSFTPTVKGIYRWIATYNGDDNNQVSAGACNDPHEQSQVLAGNNPTLDKNSNPPSGNAVQPGSTINYTVTVGNTGDVAITNAPVTDILPPHVTVKAGTISDGGVLAGGVITWHVDLAPGASHTFTYAVTVDADAPQGGVLVNTARFFNLQDTTTHVVPSGDLALVKEVKPVAGHGVVVNFGDKLTYTLTASATGGLDQTDAVVHDTLPGMDPAHPKSGDVTYVAGSAKCIGAGTCTVTGPDAKGVITWHLGAMAAGSSRQVTFQVIIKDVTGPAGSTIAEDIINQGTVQTAETPVTPSNVVVTPVSKVLPVKIGPKELPHTGATLPVGPTVGGGILLLGLGILLVATTRRRRAELLG